MTSFDVLALDAMGVLYESGDDVAELLVPFVARHGGVDDSQAIETAYVEASLGRLSARAFWEAVGVDRALEDRYLAGHALRGDVDKCLRTSAAAFASVCCISNDVAAWSSKLRRIFALEDRIARWFVSGDLGCRKPDERIYRIALDRLGTPAARLLFVDDRPRNLDAAARLGIGTIWLSSVPDPGVAHRRIGSLDELGSAA